MKITDLHVNAFGVCRELEFKKLAQDVTVIYGPNEAGKTTLMEFVRGVLYGYGADRTRYLGVHRDGDHGGWLKISDGERESGQVIRVAERNAAGRWNEELRIDETDSDLPGATWLERLLSGVDEEIFNNVFSVGLQELQELATLDATEAAEHLYDLTTGLDRVSLADVLNFLHGSQAALLSADPATADIPRLCQREQQLSAELASLARSGRNWARLAARERSLEADLQSLQGELSVWQQQQRVCEIALQVHPQWQERQLVAEQLQQLGVQVAMGAATLPANALGQLEDLNETIGTVLARIEGIREQRNVLREETDSAPRSRRVMLQAARIEAAREQGHWAASLATQSQSLTSEVARLQQDVERQFPGAGVMVGDEGGSMPELTPRVLNVLRAPSRALREERRRYQDAEDELSTQRMEHEEAAAELVAGLAELGVHDLEESVTEAARLVGQLRRRIALEEQLDRLSRNRLDLESHSQDLFDRELLPGWSLLSLGAVFVGGFVLLFTGLLLGSFFSLPTMTGVCLSLLGLGGMMAALATKHTLEKSQQRRQENCSRQQELLALQEVQAGNDRQSLDTELAGGSGAWDYRSQVAEARLAELETLVPVDARQRAAKRRIETSGLRIDQARSACEAADQRWREALQDLGLPQQLSPRHIRRLAEDARYITESQLQLRQRRMDLQRCQGELASLENRVDQLFVDTGLSPTGSDLQNKLQQLYSALQQERENQATQHQHRRRDRQLKRQGRRLVESLEDARRKKRSLMSLAGTVDEEEFRSVAGERERVMLLQQRSGELTSQLEIQLKGRCEMSQVATVLEAQTVDELNASWEEAQDQLERRANDSDRLNRKLGELIEQRRVAGLDRRMLETRFELGCVQHELAARVKQWQVSAVTEHVLQQVREIYERERQPETLKDASGFLQKMTGGRYTRVWTPLDENSLRVDDEAGNVLVLETLSRGTREAVFVCLRLALVRGYARRGMTLPVVLDDVLVNCDGQRAQQAVEVLCEFAELGHQVLFFTCHQHIVAMFEEAGVDIRTLPDTGTEVALIAEANRVTEAPVTMNQDKSVRQESESMDESVDEYEEDDEAELEEEDEE
ncbi:MAG: AAA family ATPase, partial [Pirellulaceae bacterium]